MGSDFFDLVVILILVFFSLTGFSKGFIREIASIVAVLGGFFASNALHPIVSERLVFISNPTVRSILTYVVIFAAVVILVGLIARFLLKGRDWVFAKWIDKLVGGLFGLIKGVLICALIIVVLQNLFAHTPMIQNSRTIPYINSMITQFRAWMPKDLISRLKITP
ncbi:MAG: CvpA family protein [Desulfovibrionaceae bacterium]|nr:CvpA family protein [Desulfovibrionaceae bacterium]